MVPGNGKAVKARRKTGAPILVQDGSDGMGAVQILLGRGEEVRRDRLDIAFRRCGNFRIIGAFAQPVARDFTVIDRKEGCHRCRCIFGKVISLHDIDRQSCRVFLSTVGQLVCEYILLTDVGAIFERFVRVGSVRVNGQRAILARDIHSRVHGDLVALQIEDRQFGARRHHITTIAIVVEEIAFGSNSIDQGVEIVVDERDIRRNGAGKRNQVPVRHIEPVIPFRQALHSNGRGFTKDAQEIEQAG